MACRFIYDNLITAASMITASSTRYGLVSDALKDGTGSAVMATSGAHTGDEDKEYTVEIDSVAGGAEVAQSTFRWSNGGGSWNASGVTTAATNIELENGVNIKWTSGTGDDFVIADKWYLKAIVPFGVQHMIDLHRDTRYRSSELESPNTLIVDLGSAQEVKALVIYDHNFTSGVTLTLEGHTADAWGAPDFQESVTYNADKIVHYLSSATTKRYWRLSVTDAANTDDYIEIGELMLASYFEPSRTFAWGAKRELGAVLAAQVTPYGIKRRRFYNLRDRFSYHFNQLTATDIASFRTMFETVTDRDDGTIKPVVWTPDTASASDSWLVELERLAWAERFTDQNPADIDMAEVLRSV